MEKFNKTQYDINYRKQHKVQFNVDLNKDEMDSLKEVLKVMDIKKSDFLRKAIRTSCKENNVLYFDRTAKCDWCNEKKSVAVCQYGTTHYNRLICKDCANDIIEYHKTMDNSIPRWFNQNKED